MKFDGSPDDLSISPFALGSINAGVNMYAGGGLILKRWEGDLTDSDVLDAGLIKSITFGNFNGLGFSEFVIMNAFFCVKGFAGGGGSMDVSVGITSPYADLVAAYTVSAGASTVVRGLTPTEMGTRLVTGSTFEYDHDNSPTITCRVNGTSFTGTASAGKVIVAILLMPLDGFTYVT